MFEFEEPSGHGFSRAVQRSHHRGFNPWGLSGWSRLYYSGLRDAWKRAL